MVVRTTVQSGDWSAIGTWDTGVPLNGDAVVIAAEHNIYFDVDQSGFAAGLLSLTINGILQFKDKVITYLKMNGNITGTGELFIGSPYYDEDYNTWALVEGKEKVYFIDEGNYADTIGSFIVETGVLDIFYNLVNSVDECESLEGSYYINSTDPNHIMLYVHPLDGTNPNGKHLIQTVNPIRRPAAGIESRCTIMFNATGTINLKGRGYGWYPEKETTTLSANAAAGQPVLVLTEDLKLQAGDKIVVGADIYGTLDIYATEPLNGIYTVLSYVSETKTVTLTANIQYVRASGDYIGFYSRPIKISRTSGSNALLAAGCPPVELVGVNVDTKIIGFEIPYTLKHTFNHCTFRYDLYYLVGATLSNSSFVNAGGYLGRYCYANTFDKCLLISHGYNMIAQSANNKFKECTIQNQYSIDSTCVENSFINCIVRKCKLISQFSKTLYDNCNFLIKDNGGVASLQSGNIIISNSVFENSGEDYGNTIRGKLYNCLFKYVPGIFDTLDPWSFYAFPENNPLESFDHNQVKGNYSAWMKGGKIETVLGKLKFTCSNASYPVFRDYRINVTKGLTERFSIAGLKSFTGGIVKAEIIDPANDPFIDSSAVPLVIKNMGDVANSKKEFSIGYKPVKGGEIILRVTAMNASGTFILNPISRMNKRYQDVLG